MEKLVFREFMRREIIQKTVIFAYAFGLNIDAWHPANTEDNPYRIYIFSKGENVGYVEAVPYGFGVNSIRQEMPFALSTPCGEVSGYFYVYKQIFNYNLNLESNDQLHGLFEVKRELEDGKRKYTARASISLSNGDKKTRVSFNEMGSNYVVGVSKGDLNSQEEVYLYLSSDLGNPIMKRKVSKRDDTGIYNETISEIMINLSTESTDKVPVKFSFSQMPAYLKTIDLKRLSNDELEYGKIAQIDFKPIGNEIAENDPDFISFIDEARAALTIPIDEEHSVSLYDRLARLCFHENYEKFYFDFSRATGKEEDLKDNFVLKKMDNQSGKTEY